MAIIIDIDKPHDCGPCPFNIDDCYCKIKGSQIDRDDMTPDEGCPIVETDKKSYEVERILNAYDGFIKPEEPSESKPAMIHYVDSGGLDGSEEMFIPFSQIATFKVVQKVYGTAGIIYFNDGTWIGDLPIEVIETLKSYYNIHSIKKGH